jgi:Na+/H+ antiporter NhaD/arsenite permease-like protein
MAPMVIIVVMAIIPLLLFMFRKELANTPEDRKMINELDERSFLTDIKLMKKSLFVLVLVVIAFISHSFLHLEPAIIALLGAGLLILISGLKPANYVQDNESSRSISCFIWNCG